MDQSLFTRFVSLGIPYIELNAQGRTRPSIAKLYNWRYRDLGDLPYVKEDAVFHRANAGFSYEYQLVDVPDYQANKISILTTYNGQKLLIRDVINRRCVPYDFIGPPSKVTTVDKFQGQQNDFILLSLVRTRFVGHLRDVRRLVVAMSRAQLERHVEDTGPIHLVSGVEEMISIFNWRYQERYMSHQFDHYMTYSGQNDQQNSTIVFNAMDTDTPSVQHESSMEEDTKMGMFCL
ncbi:hypothetical protein CMV_012631 [Castanea mollissima]|uniref:DNA2/NAM7 helicase-like C-terminal domain-containing protein n=1 Tax=Castanea mollissima TaxID=60419 RepID=A0A8J4R386_9ROSI|nr:hypothetical protein CMV_012631 [Castanea mollissima]